MKWRMGSIEITDQEDCVHWAVKQVTGLLFDTDLFRRDVLTSPVPAVGLLYIYLYTHKCLDRVSGKVCRPF